MIINENQLDEWVRGNSREAQGIVVELIWRLVAASCPKPKDRRFPLTDSIGQHGPDGVLEVDLSFDPFVPEGRSYWEIGTNIEASSKATNDYKGLTESVPVDIRNDTTFVFVTPLSGRRDWEFTWKEDAQATWLDSRIKRRDWKDVKIIDGTKIIDWLNQFPAVELWLAQKIGGLPPDQIEALSQHWNLICTIGEPPPLTSDLFLANREGPCSKLNEIFNGTITQLKLSTHYPDQVIDFVAAYLSSLDEESRVDVAGRCLIVLGIDGWNAICANNHWKNHILIAAPSLDLAGDVGTKLIQKARRAGYLIIFGGTPGGIPDPTSVSLPTPNSYQIQEALKKAGYTDERARVLAHKSGGNLSSLLRCIQNLSVLPEWAENSDASELAIAMILGSWNEAVDAETLSKANLLGKMYGEWIRGMRDIALRPSTPLIQRENSWKFISRFEGWYGLGKYLFDEHLNHLKDLTIPILCENDPKFELVPDQRFSANLLGKVLSHSKSLRNGLSETLALLGSHPQALTSCSLGKAEVIANLIIREIFVDADWIRWASLNDLLPLLAEAAPKEFLTAVENSLQNEPCPFNELFAQEGKGGGALFGGNYLTGILWALETLAWDEEYLTRVVICLGDLASRDPGGQLSNRPANSLRDIFLPWFPQTCAPIEKRVTAINTLITEFPYVGWKLLLSLIPNQHSVSSGTRRPTWRMVIPDDWKDGVTHQQYWGQLDLYIEMLINLAMENLSRLTELLEHLENMPPEAQNKLLDLLKSEKILALSSEDKLPLWEKLIDLVSRHRKYEYTKWAMSAEQILAIEEVAYKLEPEQPFFIHQRLFTDRFTNLFDEKGDFESQTRKLEEKRQNAIKDIFESGGIESVQAFVVTVESPWRVGISFGLVSNTDVDSKILPSFIASEVKPLSHFVSGFIWGRFYNLGWSWADGIDKSIWAPDQIGQFLAFLPFQTETWSRAEYLLGEEQSEYWMKASANPYDTKEDLEYAIEQLLKYGRVDASIRCIYKLVLDKKDINTDQAIRSLLELIKSERDHNATDVYEIAEIVKVLQDNPDTNPDGLFRVEWAYLPLLDGHHGATPKVLWKKLANEPDFFCEVIQIAFKSKKEKVMQDEISEIRKSIATNAYRLLSDWKYPPGMRSDGSFNKDFLISWLDNVMRKCNESGHLEIALTMIGHVLIYTPADPTGLWIDKSVAEVLNSKDANDIRNGFISETFNSRGVHWIDPTGKPEKELSQKYSYQAAEVEKAGYHRLAVSIRDLAHSYEQEARRISSRNFDDE